MPRSQNASMAIVLLISLGVYIILMTRKKVAKGLESSYSSIFYILFLAAKSFLELFQFAINSKMYIEMLFYVLQYILIWDIQRRNPGIITSSTIRIAEKIWPVDGCIYKAHDCKHTKFPAIPRSRYIKEKEARVARYISYSSQYGIHIGYSNYRNYLYLLFSSTVLSIFSVFLGCSMMCDYFNQQPSHPVFHASNPVLQKIGIFIKGSLTLAPYGLISIIMNIVSSFFLVILLLFHVWMISFNITPHEMEKYQTFRFENRINKKPMPKNVYSKGFIGNWKEVLFPEF